jgi:hypothetical protein
MWGSANGRLQKTRRLDVIADLQKRDQAKVMELLRSVRQKRLTVALFRIHEGKWWWVNDGQLLRPLTTGEVIELAKMDHPSFTPLCVLAENYRQVQSFCRKSGLAHRQFIALVMRQDMERREGLQTFIILAGTPAEIESETVARLQGRPRAIYWLEEKGR